MGGIVYQSKRIPFLALMPLLKKKASIRNAEEAFSF
jgi:hypothetical protein